MAHDQAAQQIRGAAFDHHNLKIDMPDARKLFADDYRFDSHGCTRVDNVRDLAAWILQDNPPGWDRAAVEAGIATGQTKIINLLHKISVAWVYLTGWVTRDGTVEFRDDVYKQRRTARSRSAERRCSRRLCRAIIANSVPDCVATCAVNGVLYRQPMIRRIRRQNYCASTTARVLCAAA